MKKHFTKFCCNFKVHLATSLLFAILLAVSLILWFIIIPDLIDDEVKKGTRLDNGTAQMDRFVELPFPLLFKVYVFEIVNKEGVLNGSEKPIVREKGPYSYNQYRRKTILIENDEDDTFTFNETETLIFNPDESISKTDEDIVTVINPVMLSLLQKSTTMEQYILNTCIEDVFEDGYGSLIINIPVKKLLFDGIDYGLDVDPSKNKPWCFIVNWDIRVKSRVMTRNAFEIRDENGTLTGLTFSYFNFKNGTSDAPYTIKRGRQDISTLGSIVAWNNSKFLYNWGQSMSSNNETCAIVRGSDSTLYPPNIKTDETFEVFSTDICRSIEMKYKGDDSYKGIDGYLYKTDSDTLRTSLMSAENDCYCSKQALDENGNEQCYLDGFIDMTPCYHTPILFSHPHFLWVDEKYHEQVDGLAPNEEKHSTFVLLEPNTGTPISGMKRIQLNGVLRPEPYIDLAKSVSRAIVPLIWVEEGVSLDDEYIEELNDKYFNKVEVANIIKIFLVAFSSLGIVGFAGFSYYRMYRSNGKTAV